MPPKSPPLDEFTRARALAILDDEQQWLKMYPRLLRAAAKRSGSLAKAQDLVSDALVLVRQGVLEGSGRIWDPTKHPNLRKYLVGVIISLLSHDRTCQRTTYERSDRPAHVDRAADTTSNAHDVLRAGHKVRRGHLRLETAEARLTEANDELGLAALRGLIDDDLDPSALADERGIPTREVYAAIRRARDQLKAAMKVHPDSDDAIRAAASVKGEREDLA